MSYLLFNDPPLVVNPRLATLIGLNEAIILQQIHYWVQINKKSKKNYKDGYYWTYNSIPGWCEQFPFWSEGTVKRTFSSLKKQNLIIVSNYNKLKKDRTNWYRVNYENLPSDQNDPMDQIKMIRCTGSKCDDGSDQNDPTITRDYNEIIDEKKYFQQIYETIKGVVK